MTLRFFVTPAVLTTMLVGCASGPTSWTHSVTYHALVVASLYQEQVQIVVARISLPGLSFEQVDEQVARRLERSVGSLTDVATVKTQSTDGHFVMEVHFKNGAGKAELAEVQQAVKGFLSTASLPESSSTVTVALPSLL